MTIDHALARARKAAKNGNVSLARDLYTAILEQQPTHRVARKGLKRLRGGVGTRLVSKAEVDRLADLYRGGQMEQAVRQCRQLLRRDPTSVLALNILGSALHALGDIVKAVAAYDRALTLHPEFAEAYNNRGNAHKALGQADAALADFDRAIALRPGYAEAWFNRGNMLRDAGRFAEAIESYERAVSIVPDFAPAYRSLGSLKAWQAGDPLLAAMEASRERLTATDPRRAEICFALAKASEDLGDIDAGYRLLEEGNRLRAAALDYSIDTDRASFERIRSMAQYLPSAAAISADGKRTVRPIFIVGMMRSGTSLVEQILASHPDVHGAGELEVLNRLATPLLESGGDPVPADITGLRSRYLKTLDERQVRAPVVTDKMPLNFRWIGLILSAFPNASIVHVHRNPVATCWSIYKHFFPAEGHGYAWQLADIADYFDLYRELMAFWHEQYPGVIYDLCYETLTEQQEAETRRLLDYCDLGWDPACLEFYRAERMVATSSVAQVRKRMYQGSSSAWRRYESMLLGREDGRAFIERLS